MSFVPSIGVSVPRLTDVDVKSIRKFLAEREQYIRQVEQYNIGYHEDDKTLPVSVRNSMSPEILSIICGFELVIEIEDASDEVLLEYLTKVVTDSLHVDDNMATLPQLLKTNIHDSGGNCSPTERVSKLWIQVTNFIG